MWIFIFFLSLKITKRRNSGVLMVYVAALMTETRHLESNLAPTNNKAHTGTDK